MEKALQHLGTGRQKKTYLERPIENHLMGGMELSKDFVLDVLNVFAKVQKVAELLLPDEFLDGVLPLEVLGDPGQ